MAADTSCDFGGKKMPTPLLIAAGQPTGAPGQIKDLAAQMAEMKWSGIVTKTVSYIPPFLLRPHFWKSAQYGISAMQNHGPPHSTYSPSLMESLSQDVSACHKEGLVIIGSCMGRTIDEWEKLAVGIASTGVDGIELNINFGIFTRHSGQTTEVDSEKYETAKVPTLVHRIVGAVAKSINIPVIPKFTAHLIFPSEIAKICQDAGASGISAINTLRGLIGIDVKSHIPLSVDVTGKAFMGGISGPVIKPVGLATVAEIVKGVSIPVYGIGGVTDWMSGVEFLLVGVQAFQVCTGMMLEGLRLGKRIHDGIVKYMEESDYQKISDFRGAALKYLSDDPYTRSEAISVIDPTKCTKCLRCVVACREAGYQAIVTDKKADFLVQVLPEKCTGCGLCLITCKDDAVKIRERAS
jgi:dihydropyrimidine dehydrogenase (NAD+) subunit PreA